MVEKVQQEEESPIGTSTVAPLFQAAPKDAGPSSDRSPRRRATRKAAPPDSRDVENSRESTSSSGSRGSTAPADESAVVTKDAEPADGAGGASETSDGTVDDDKPRRRRGGRGKRRKVADDIDDGAEGRHGSVGSVGSEGSVGNAPNDVSDSETHDSSDPDSQAEGKASGSDVHPAKTGVSDEIDSPDAETDESADEAEGGTHRRRRRRRRSDVATEELAEDDPPNTVVKVREPRSPKKQDSDNARGSTRLEAKRQRRKEGRDANRRRAPLLTEAEFLARRESLERIMVVRQADERTQIAVLEDGVLVEHYVTKGSAVSMIGNVYLGRVQNVLPSMEAAFVDIGKGRNAVLYAGEVNWEAAGLEGQAKRIEAALKPGDPVLVQVTKDPVGQKGARLTSQISLPGRFLVYVPDGSMTGISRKLPDTQRSRLKAILKKVMPEDAGVIVRTAAEGASEEALEADVERLQALWTDITDAAKKASPPEMLYSEPDLAIKVVRDMFNEDVDKFVVSGASAWRTVDAYISAVAPDLLTRLEHWVEPEDVFAHYRVEEQLLKALDRKVWLPSGGSLVVDRTEAMTVIDVNTGKFIGSGGNLEQTVTKNNLEAAEEIVRQLRLRDIGGIIVVDFIDMVLESNRDLVLRRLVECLGRDRTKHQVAEVTSLGLVQMTRKRIGSGLLESFSEPCEICSGRGVVVSMEHAHEPAPRGRRPVGAVDPAEVAARSLVDRDAGSSVGEDGEIIPSADPVDPDELPGTDSDQSLFASDD